MDCDKVIPSSDAEVVKPSSDAEEVIPSDAEEVIQSSDAKVMDGVDNSQQENQVLGDLLRVTVQELCDCPKYTPVTVLTLCDCLSDSLHQCFLLYFSQSFPWIATRSYRHRMPRRSYHRMPRRSYSCVIVQNKFLY